MVLPNYCRRPSRCRRYRCRFNGTGRHRVVAGEKEPKVLNIRSTSVVVGALLVVAALGWGLPAQAAEADSDTTFGTDGVVFTGFAAGNSAPNGVALQADGKIVA